LQSFRTDRLFAAIWIVMLMSLAMFKLVDGVSEKLTPWLRRRQRA
jgi:ABC-type nitrate/sulfonate/bicarbonate transport system permease component